MKYPNVCILGGTGFVGRHLCNALNDAGHQVTALTRRRDRHRDLLVLPRVRLVETDVYDTGALTESFSGCQAVVNLVGILNEKGNDGSGFRKAHIELAEKVIKACRDAGVERLLHMSALRADAERGTSHYLRTKGEAEKRVHAAASERLRVTSFQPSVIFGNGDSFFNRFAQLLRFAPGIFPLACPDSRFAPVYVGDVVRAFSQALEDPASHDQRYQLCGPKVYTLKQLVEFTAECIDVRRKVIGLSEGLSRTQARVLEWVPGKPMSRDNFGSLQLDSVCSEDGFAALKIEPRSVEEIVPQYLADQRVRDRYDQYRSGSDR